MKASQEYCSHPGWWDRFPEFAAIFAVLFGLLPLLLAAAAMAAPARERGATILQGPRPGPCAGATAGAEYIGGTDAYGHRVAPADLPGVATAELDSETVYPIVRNGRHDPGTEVKVDVNGLSDVLAAPTGCAPRR